MTVRFLGKLIVFTFAILHLANTSAQTRIEVTPERTSVELNGHREVQNPEFVSMPPGLQYNEIVLTPATGFEFAAFAGSLDFVDLVSGSIDGLQANVVYESPSQIVIGVFQGDNGFSADHFATTVEMPMQSTQNGANLAPNWSGGITLQPSALIVASQLRSKGRLGFTVDPTICLHDTTQIAAVGQIGATAPIPVTVDLWMRLVGTCEHPILRSDVPESRHPNDWSHAASGVEVIFRSDGVEFDRSLTNPNGRAQSALSFPTDIAGAFDVELEAEATVRYSVDRPGNAGGTFTLDPQLILTAPERPIVETLSTSGSANIKVVEVVALTPSEGMLGVPDLPDDEPEESDGGDQAQEAEAVPVYWVYAGEGVVTVTATMNPEDLTDDEWHALEDDWELAGGNQTSWTTTEIPKDQPGIYTIAAVCGASRQEIQIIIASVEVDLLVQGLAEEGDDPVNEVNVGALIRFNGDDDNGNQESDYNDTDLQDDDDFEPAAIGVRLAGGFPIDGLGSPPDGFFGTVRLDATDGIRVWEKVTVSSSENSETEWSLVNLPKEWPIEAFVDFPDQSDANPTPDDEYTITTTREYFVEGVDPSGFYQDQAIQLAVGEQIDLVVATVVHVDLSAQGLPEEHLAARNEISPGMIVGLNNDNDDQPDTTIDLDQPGPINGEDDLQTIALSYYPRDLPFGVLSLTTQAQNAVWLDPEKGDLSPNFWLTGSGAFGNQALPPASIYLESVDLGTANISAILLGSPAHMPTTTDMIVVQNYGIDIDIDSDNNNGTNPPDRDDELEDLVEADPNHPPKYLVANIDDGNQNGIPDFADVEPESTGLATSNRSRHPSDESQEDRSTTRGSSQNSGGEDAAKDWSLVPVIIEVPPNVNLDECSVIFEYYADNLPPTVIDPADIEVGPSGSGIFDYHAIRSAQPLRLWRIDSADAPRSADLYIVPGEEMPANTFFQDGRTVTLYLEAIRGAPDVPITAILQTGDIQIADLIRVRAIELNIGVNNSNNSTTLLPGVPDAEWIIDTYDESHEDQGRRRGTDSRTAGYPLWYGYDYQDKTVDNQDFEPPLDANGEPQTQLIRSGAVPPYGIEDTHPFTVSIPEDALEHFDVWIRPIFAEDDDLSPGFKHFYVFGATSPGNDRLRYLKSGPRAQDQLDLCHPDDFRAYWGPELGSADDQWRKLDLRESDFQGASAEFLIYIQASGQNILGDFPAMDRTADVTIAAALVPKDGAIENRQIGDSILCATGDNFFTAYSFWSSGGNPVSTPEAPDPTRDAADPMARYSLVYIHGFNYVSWREILLDGSTSYRRKFRAGFRGNFYVFGWFSGQADWPILQPFADAGVSLWFDKAVQNGFNVAPAMLDLMETTILPAAGHNPSNIDLMAHSLGNLPMWEMLRMSDDTLCRNAFGIQAALWADAFREAAPLNYGGSAEPSPDRVFTRDQMLRTSWREHWQAAQSSIGATYHHSYNYYDDALWNKMRASEWLVRSSGANAPEPLLALLNLPELGSVALGTKRTQQDRVTSEEACLAIRSNVFQGDAPQIHLSRTSGFLSFDEERTTLPVHSGVNQMAREVPALLAVHSNGRFVSPTDPARSGPGTVTHLNLLAPTQGLNQIEIEEYLFTHLDPPHGCGPSPLSERTVNWNMFNSGGFTEWGHGDHRSQTLPFVWKFYSPVAFDELGEGVFLWGTDLHEP